jgi:hypothetical protein
LPILPERRDSSVRRSKPYWLIAIVRCPEVSQPYSDCGTGKWSTGTQPATRGMPAKWSAPASVKTQASYRKTSQSAPDRSSSSRIVSREYLSLPDEPRTRRPSQSRSPRLPSLVANSMSMPDLAMRRPTWRVWEP